MFKNSPTEELASKEKEEEGLTLACGINAELQRGHSLVSVKIMYVH